MFRALRGQNHQTERTEEMQNTKKLVTEYEIEEIGLEWSSYFSGRGVSFTRWEDVYVGSGDTPEEALEDALEQAAMSDWEFQEDPIPDAELYEPTRDLVQEWLDEQEREALANVPTPVWKVEFNTFGGMLARDYELDSSKEARESISRELRATRNRGFVVETLKSGKEWEILSPGNVSGVAISDEDGILSLSDNVEEVWKQREQVSETFSEDLEFPSVLVAVYVK